MATYSNTTFDWSLLNRDSIAGFLYTLAPEIANQSLTVVEFHTKITKLLKKYIPVRVRRSYNIKVDPGFVFIGGTYYSGYDEDNVKCIEIVFEYRTDQKILTLSKKRFAGICINIADTMLHEVIHMRQFRRRNFKYLPDYASNAEKTKLREEQSYLGCSDEIDAYGFNIACELMDKFKSDQTAVIEYLNENQQGKNRRHNSWRMYLKAFEHDHNHPILQRVKKKVVRYMAAYSSGKPYRNKDWINW
jgi:hypothetical protein